MEPLNKLEMILQGMIRKNKKEIQQAKNGGMHLGFQLQNLFSEFLDLLGQPNYFMRITKDSFF